MEFKEFYVEGLFDLYNHRIDFAKSKSSEKRASIIMLYGKNGVGKTTVLRMIEGLMQLDFTVFRQISFKTAFLKFSNNHSVSVKSVKDNDDNLTYLEVEYNGMIVKLDPSKVGALNSEEIINQDKVRAQYKTDLKEFSFEFIDTERLMKRNLKNEEYKERVGKLAPRKELNTTLAEKVSNFITQSQVYSGRFFSNDEPELFEKILSSIESSDKINAEDLKKKILSLTQIERKFQFERLGIVQEKWDRGKLNDILELENKKKNPSLHKLTVINSYLEVLESRYTQKQNLADRLLIFETILNDFLIDKKVVISIEQGFEIKTIKNQKVYENQLSTGEYHLLYLTVLALCTTVQGTVIAIDEPEMSMHISWQNNLINALLKISSRANPQFIFATHSPDIAANYFNSMQTEPDGN